ncbi:MAG: translocation/assembly module TamB domain-containing protein [Nitrospirae bacterium]|nr:translocation/assembly module TamB domain-containing protein [Nitrospirota bacterium]
MKKNIFYITILILCFGFVIYASRGPNISNALKKRILPELEAATGNKFIAQNIVINLFPFAVEMKGVKSFDANGNRIFTAERVKSHISLFSILRKELRINRIVIKDAEYSSDIDYLKVIVKNVKNYIHSETSIPLTIVIKSVDVKDSSLKLSGEEFSLNVEELSGEAVFAKENRFRVIAKDLGYRFKEKVEIHSMVETVFSLTDMNMNIQSIKIFSSDSKITSTGFLGLDRLNGELRTEISLLVETVKHMFGLKNHGGGHVSAKGVLKFEDLNSLIAKTLIDMKIKGSMHLETLMELIGVKSKLSGYMKVDGKLNGYLNNLAGDADASIEAGNIFGVEIDSASCGVKYKNGRMMFNNGKASLYGGSGVAEVMITLPSVDSYSLMVKVKDVSSDGIFNLIGWHPKIPDGKVSGEIGSSGSLFRPYGYFQYKSKAIHGNILSQITNASGNFKSIGDTLNFDNLTASSFGSSASGSGSINFQNNSLLFKGEGWSDNVKHLASPYFTALSGKTKAHWNLSGTFDDPVININASIINSSLHSAITSLKKSYDFDSIKLDASYSKNSLVIKNLSMRSPKESLDSSGSIAFKKPLALFDFRNPEYSISLSASGIDIADILGLAGSNYPVTGTVNTKMDIFGPAASAKASYSFKSDNLMLSGKHRFSDVEGSGLFDGKEFKVDRISLKKGRSKVAGQGMISTDRHFKVSASGNIETMDILEEHIKERLKNEMIQEISLRNVKVEGEGTLDNPLIEINGHIAGGIYRGQTIGKGSVAAILKGRDIIFNAKLLDDKMAVKGKARLDQNLSWSFDADLEPARYDLFISGLFKNIPEDLLLSLSGKVSASGDKEHTEALIRIHKAHLYLYGNAFTNNEDIIARLVNKDIRIDKFNMKNDISDFSVGGNIAIGQGYSLLLEGDSSLGPLKTLSKEIDVLKGSASFVFFVSGDWENPKVNGGMDVSGATLGFKSLPYRFSSLNAYIYVDDNRINIERTNAKLAGGDVSIRGNASIQNFLIKKFFIEAGLKRITTSWSKDFWTNSDGTLYFHGTQETYNLRGDISIRRAKYSERIDWKSWLGKVKDKDSVKSELSKLDKINLNLRILGKNIQIDNNAARTAIEMDLLLKGTVGQPVLLGKAETREGLVFFRNNQFKILKARIDFSNPSGIRPYFDIVSETRVANYKIRMSLDGYSEQFNLALSSDPNLEETDIFSLLTVGHIGKNVKGLEGGIGAAEATSFMTGKLQDVIEERLKTITGIDRVHINPYVSRTTGTLTPRVTVAKRLFGDKLYATYTAAIGSVDEQIWKLEYLLGENASLLGVRDERGGIGGDIKFRFEFK